MSIFHTAKFKHLFPISLLAFEHLNTLQHLPAEEALTKVLAECCDMPNPTEEEALYFLARIKEDSEEAQKKVDESPAPTTDKPVAKSLGTAYQEFLRQLDSARLLLWACGFDFKKAEYLYSRVDRSISSQILEDFLRLQNEQNNYLFESGLYGAGGSYKEGELDADTIDMTDMDSSEIMAFLR